jgi:hypothetical protein
MAKKITNIGQTFEDAKNFHSSGNSAGVAKEAEIGAGRAREVIPEEPQEALIETIHASQAMPDRFQTRHPILPAEIRYRFWRSEIDCFQAAREWLELANQDVARAEQVNALIDMGSSFEEEGQVNAITGQWQPTPSGARFVIETGERRFWAAVLFATLHGITDPSIRVTVAANTSRKRQVIENQHNSKPGAVSQAREIAAVLLEMRSVAPRYDDLDGDPYDYFRQVNTLSVKQAELKKLGELTRITLTPQRVNQILKILEFPTPLLDVADLYELSSRRLLKISTFPREDWNALLTQAVEEKAAQMADPQLRDGMNNFQGLDAEAEIDDGPAVGKPEKGSRFYTADRRAQPAVKALTGLRRFFNTLARCDASLRAALIDQIADEIAGSGDQGAENLAALEELASMIRARLKRM